MRFLPYSVNVTNLPITYHNQSPSQKVVNEVLRPKRTPSDAYTQTNVNLVMQLC